MSVYIDTMFNWDRRIGRAGPYWSHLLADTPEELHAFAQDLELKRAWFQGDHYDIGTQRLWDLAVRRGAIHQTGKEWFATVSRIRKVFKNASL